jgi:glycolate oxidase iron-sulfur subunit
VQTDLPEIFLATADGSRADGILRACVHCGFCNATCPTYQLLGDELDGPQGTHLPDQGDAGEPGRR